MFVYLYILVTFLLPVIAFLIFISNKNNYSYNWWMNLLLLVVVFLFVYQLGAWPYAGFYWRYILGIIFLSTIVFILYKRKQNRKKNSIEKGIVSTIFVLVFLAGNAEAFIGNYRRGAETIDLEFPLRNGKYVIQQGGNSELNNLSHRSRIPASEAFDIIKLNHLGMRSEKLTPENVNDYVIYGDTVYSPCDCTVELLRNGIEDNVPPFMNTVDRGGNFVILKKGDVNIILCHLQLNSLMVKKNQKLKSGDPIGLVGNTGFSIEPHLHIQAYRNGIRGNDQLVIRFDGSIPKMNDVIQRQ